MVATATLERELAQRGFKRLMRWSRGVDASSSGRATSAPFDLPRPIFLCCGRLAVEKNLGAFLSLDLPGSKLVVGDGPARRALETRFPEAHFAGALQGEALAAAYASADVFVFPSLTDTFGIVLLEALASGLPVAAFPVAGPIDVLGESGAGVLDHDLAKAALAALDIPREKARAHALTFSWEACARQFIDNVQSAHAKDARFARRSWLRRRRAAAPSLQAEPSAEPRASAKPSPALFPAAKVAKSRPGRGELRLRRQMHGAADETRCRQFEPRAGRGDRRISRSSLSPLARCAASPTWKSSSRSRKTSAARTCS